MCVKCAMQGSRAWRHGPRRRYHGCDAGSFNGRTAAFEAVNLGSNPSPATTTRALARGRRAPAPIVLQDGRTRVTVDPRAGGRIAQIEVRINDDWRPLLVPREHPRVRGDALRWGCYVMAPWPNRVAGAEFAFRGDQHSLPPNDGRHALHGVVADVPWEVLDADGVSCVLERRFGRRWPFGGFVRHHIAVRDGGLSLRLELHAGAEAYPAGAGWHPWLLRPRGGDVRIHVDAAHRYELRGAIPTGKLLRVTGEHDLRRDPIIGSRRLDDCYVASHGPLSVQLGDVALTMSRSRALGHVQVFTPSHAVCVEPQSCAPDAFNLQARGIGGSGACVVTPARPLVLSSRWRWTMVRR